MESNSSRCPQQGRDGIASCSRDGTAALEVTAHGRASNEERPARLRASEHPALSEVLTGIAADTTRERISVHDLLEVVGDRAFGALIFIFALPNLVPTPPGTSALLGLPLILLAAQFLWGRQTPWLPHFIGRRSIVRGHLESLASRVVPPLRRVERVLKPRLGLLVTPTAERLLGLALLLLAIIIFLPVPFGNILPAASICLISLALIEHDGLVVFAGLILGVLSILLVWGTLFTLMRTGLALVKTFGWL